MSEVTKAKVKNNIDMINGPIFKSILLFTIPILISRIFQQVYNLADTYIVGRTLGTQAYAAVGSVNSVFDLINGFALGIGNGLAIVTSRAFGTKDYKLIRRSVAGALVVGLLSSVLLTVLSLLTLKPLMTMIHVPDELFDQAYHYMYWIILFLTVMFAYNLAAGLLRAIGNSVMPLIFLIFSSLLNIVLDLVFIVGFRMKVEGAAIATVIAQGISVILCVIYIFKETKILIPTRRDFAFEGRLYYELIGQGYAMALQSAIVNAGSVVLQSGINAIGTKETHAFIIAGHTAARKMFMFCNMPFASLSQGITVYASQNIGAGRKDRVRKGMKDLYLFDIGLTIVMTVIIMWAAPFLIGFFASTDNRIAIDNGTLYLRVVSPNYAILGILLQTRSALQGIGRKLLPLVSSVIEFVGKIIFVMIFIPRFQYMAVIFCEPVIWYILAVYLLWIFWKIKW